MGREFATMSDDERRRFLNQQGETLDEPEELDFGNPRDEEHMGRHYASASDEVADPEARDGGATQLDDEAHDRAVREQDGQEQ